MSATPPRRFGVIGMHGFSRTHLQWLEEMERAGDPVRTALVVGHDRERDEAYAAALEARGIALVPDLDTLLARRDEIDILTVPVGIGLHVPFSIRGLEAGLPVYVEKPVAGAIQDVDRLIEAEKKSGRPVYVGFQHQYHPFLWDFKRTILGGAWGRLRRASVLVCWPRDSAYFSRNPWVGRLRSGGAVVLDSPANNACSHYMMMALFLAGAAVDASARPRTVTAEIYRANPIESGDVFSLRIETEEGVEILYHAAHPVDEGHGPAFRFECENATLSYDSSADAERWFVERDGRREAVAVADRSVTPPFRGVLRLLRGEADVEHCTLAMARPHTLCINGAHLSSPIRDVPAGAVREKPAGEGATLRYVEGLREALETCHAKGFRLADAGAFDWTRSGEPVEVTDLVSFEP